MTTHKDNNNGKGQGQQEAQKEANDCRSPIGSGKETCASAQAESALSFSFELSPALRDLLEFERHIAEDFRVEMAEYVARINRAMAESECETFRQHLHSTPLSVFMK